MGKGWLFGKLGRGGEQQLKNTPMEINSQGKKSAEFRRFQNARNRANVANY